MKKTVLFAAMAASMGLMSSCTKDDLSAAPSVKETNTIAFSTNQRKSTRSGETITSISRFNVTAVDGEGNVYFNNEEFVYDGSESVFKSGTPHYWPTTGTLSFYAVSDIDTYTAGTGNVPEYSYSDWEAEKDLVAATVLAGEKEIPYPLAFHHLTSQIYVSAEAENKTEELTYNLVAIKMTAPSSGTYHFADATGGVGTWEIDNTSTSEYSFAEALPVSFRQNGEVELSNCYWNILPVTDGSIKFDIEYQVLQNGRIISDFTGNNSKKCIINSPNLQSGMMYNYNFILTRSTDDEVTFTITINAWGDGTSSSDTPSSPVSFDANGYEYVDLGLPSGTLWATCDVGETTAVGARTRFKWGETVASTSTSQSSYKYYVDNNYVTYTSTGYKTLKAEDDAAHQIMGGDWQMPSVADITELLQNTDVTVDGYVRTFTSKSDPTKKMVVQYPFDDYSGRNYGFWSSELQSDGYAYCLGTTGANEVVVCYKPLPVRGIIKPSGN